MMYSYNQNFFKTINTEEKAYILGLIFADGWVRTSNGTRLCISLHEDDKDLLFNICDILESNHYPYKLNNKNQYILDICSSQIVNDLSKYGIVENKTFKILFPKLDDCLIRHFIRGYFDGDGCVWSGKRYFKKFPSRPNGRIIHNVKFNITGHIDFINSLQDYLCKNLNFKKTKLCSYTFRTDAPVATLEYSGRSNLKKFYDFIYKDAKVFMKRKYNKFNEIFCALNEKSLSETRLIAGKPEMAISSQAESNSEGSSTIPEMEVESSDSKCLALNR